jgi:hypothetical protein
VPGHAVVNSGLRGRWAALRGKPQIGTLPVRTSRQDIRRNGTPSRR